MTDLTNAERSDVAEILSRRANEISMFAYDYRRKPDHYGSVELALTREIQRLRRLADKVNPPEPENDD